MVKRGFFRLKKRGAAFLRRLNFLSIIRRFFIFWPICGGKGRNIQHVVVLPIKKFKIF